MLWATSDFADVSISFTPQIRHLMWLCSIARGRPRDMTHHGCHYSDQREAVYYGLEALIN